ncbi:hypothetical protein SAMN06266787_1328 [Halorubrum ezzemoulense]|uniref:DUF8165 domain-containing protein n=1 Tax=Halorubrum ezzemoulense TaxID=337243 RepID=A0A238Z7M5_HALEZ|nr:MULTISPECIES: hypothetical protein [Halorubrum]TKX62430.1 hypothetical protein EXE47_16290 [Halorubrum sp. GN12_10-3_MGM]SNR79039.1 hypothetical protein SAMN06266787_1328 [Halorubrum ezzemoulense]
MLKGHYNSAGTSIEYGAADDLFPVEELDATVHQYRDAQLALADVDGASVIIIAPTNLASSYHLTQHALTAIPVESLPPAIQTQIADTINASLEAFKLIQIGKWNSNSPNHSLGEFVDA